jgi:hemerythrin
MQWTEDLSVGVETIDNQRRELFIRINSLADAIRQGKCKCIIHGVITFFEDYAASHFSAEEAFMQHHAYPEYQLHRQQHARYLSSLSGLKHELAELGPSTVLSVRTTPVFIDWIVVHILPPTRSAEHS